MLGWCLTEDSKGGVYLRNRKTGIDKYKSYFKDYDEDRYDFAPANFSL